MNAALSAAEYEKLSTLLSRWTGIRLHAKEHLMSGRLLPRLRELGITDFAAYREYLEDTGQQGPEAQNFINALTTNKTSFFRESHHFDFVVRRLFPEIRARTARGGNKRLRLWSAGCSRGAEPYTLALLAAEHMPLAQGWDVRILATDLDTEILAEAQAGIYETDEIGDVPAGLRKYFTHERGGYKIKREVASLVTFAQANLIASPFPVRGQFDAVLCRNVMIYFDRPTQNRVVSQLIRCVAPHGYLIVGHSESMLVKHLQRSGETVGVYTHPAPQEARPQSSLLPQTGRRLSRRPGALGRISHAPPARSLLPRMAAQHHPAPSPGTRLTAARGRPPVAGLQIKRIVLGEWFTTRETILISTLLGSCVSACLHDPVARVGGMNHFMLPKALGGSDQNPARFGIHAMEVLINELMQLGAQRARLRAMAFGAAAINPTISSTVAAQNGTFVKAFLAKEQIPLVFERLGGVKPREVYLRTDTGEAFIRNVEPSSAIQLERAELDAYTAKTPPLAQEWKADDALF